MRESSDPETVVARRLGAEESTAYYWIEASPAIRAAEVRPGLSDGSDVEGVAEHRR